tara:strand:+ start:553 stop:702 length:150 start_codon:yes stop_codon:yes gene_type:complete
MKTAKAWIKPTLTVLGDANTLIMGSGNVKDENLSDGFTLANGTPIGTSS